MLKFAKYTHTKISSRYLIRFYLS